jgi:hypothetical protein
MAEITEADVRQYVQEATSSEDIRRAILVVEKLRGCDPECRAINAAMIAFAISQARTMERPQITATITVEETETLLTDRQMLHNALRRSMRLPGG